MIKTVLTKTAAAVIFLLGAAHVSAQTNLVTNGGFESGSVGWIDDNFVDTFAHTGNNSLAFGCVGSPCATTQNISSLSVGRNYTLSFWLKPDGGTPSNFVVAFGGTQLLSLTNTASSGYTHYTYTVAPTATTQLLSFNGQNDPGYWQLDDVSLFLLGSLGPTAADTLASMQRNADAMRRIFSLQAAYVNPGLSYDCTTFDKNGVCVAVSGRYSSTTGSGPEATSGILTAAYKVNPNIRIGAFIEQFATDINSNGVQLSNTNPDFGAFGVWSQTQTGEGMKVRAAYRYGNHGVTITRDAIGTGEAGTGNSYLTTQGAQLTVSNGYRLNSTFLASPYVGLRYTNIKRNGYTESASASVTTPLTYSTLSQESTSLLLGVNLAAQVASALTVSGTVGVETDTSQKISNYSASGVTDLGSIQFNNDTRRTRAVASASVAYQVGKAQQISAQLVYREEAYGSTSTATGMLTYSAGF